MTTYLVRIQRVVNVRIDGGQARFELRNGILTVVQELDGHASCRRRLQLVVDTATCRLFVDGDGRYLHPAGLLDLATTAPRRAYDVRAPDHPGCTVRYESCLHAMRAPQQSRQHYAIKAWPLQRALLQHFGFASIKKSTAASRGLAAYGAKNSRAGEFHIRVLIEGNAR